MNKVYEQTILKSLNKYKGMYETFIINSTDEDKKNIATIIESCIEKIDKIYTSNVYSNEFIEKSERFANYIQTITEMSKKMEADNLLVYIKDVIASQSSIAVLSNYEDELIKNLYEEKLK
ncbi:MAG: hypothetical protein WC942_08470 [Clostridia bacterium]|jgi:hypothetical protein|nr:hypothetical protein [Clostridia bacterium]